MRNRTDTQARQAGKPRRTAAEHLAFIVNELICAPLYIGKMR